MRAPCAVCHCCRFLGTSLIPPLTLDLAGRPTQGHAAHCRCAHAALLEDKTLAVYAHDPCHRQELDLRGMPPVSTNRRALEKGRCVCAPDGPRHMRGQRDAGDRRRGVERLGRSGEAQAGGSIAAVDGAGLQTVFRTAGTVAFGHPNAGARRAAKPPLQLSARRSKERALKFKNRAAGWTDARRHVGCGVASQDRLRHATRLTRWQAPSPPIDGKRARLSFNACANPS